MNFIKTKLTAAILISISLTACSPDKTSAEYLSSAKNNIQGNNQSEAVIELKNAIRADLKNPEARLLLGSLYLDNGQAAAAEKELRQALKLGSDKNAVLPKLLKAYHLQDMSDESLALVEQHPDINESIKPQVLLYTALAQSKLGKNNLAKEAISDANDISAESVFSRFGSAYLQADTGELDNTLILLDQVLNDEPALTEALLLKGQILSIKKDYPAAIEAFNRYFELLPNDIKIRLYLANTYVKNAQFEQADKHLDILLKIIPEHPLSNQLKGLSYFEKSEHKLALSHTEKAIQNGLNSTPNKIIAGLSAFHLKQYEQAHQYLVATKNVLPNNHPVKKVLAITQMQLGYTDDASETLDELESLTESDTSLLTAASFELLKSGKIDAAKSLVNKANNVVGENSEEITKLGILQLSMNDLDGLTNLEKALEIDPELPMAKMALAAAYIQNNELDKALALANKWKEQSPEQVEGYNLAAKVLLLQNKITEAEAQITQALTVKPDNAYSLLYLSNKHLNNKELEPALAKLDTLLVSSPDHVAALIQHFRINTLLNAPEQSLDKIKASFERNTDKLNYRITYARALYSEKQFSNVVEILTAYKNVNKNTPDIYWMLLGDSQRNLNKNSLALDTYNDWISNRETVKQAWLQKVSLQEQMRDLDGAINTIKSAQKVAPNDLQLKALLISFYIENKQINHAQQAINKLTNEQQKLVYIEGLQGMIWLAEKQYEKSLPSLQAFYQALPNSRNAIYVVSNLKALSKTQAAFDFIKGHVTKQPNDNLAKIALAELAIEFDKNLARQSYEELLATTPDNGTFLNNIAWVEYLLANYDSADKYATRAIDVLGEHPQVLDSAGLIKLKMGLKEEGIALLEKANLLAPNDAEIAEHLEQAKK